MSAKLKFSAVALSVGFLGVSVFAATPPTASTADSATRQAQDSTNGSMTNTDLTGNVDKDTSALQKEPTTGTTSGAITDRASETNMNSKTQTKTKSKMKKPMPKAKPTTESTTSGTSTSYGTDAVDEVMTTQGVTPNDAVLSGSSGHGGSSSSTSGGGGF